MNQTKISSFVKSACKSMDDNTYKTRTAYYTDRKRPELAAFVQYLFAAAERYIETGTIQHLTNAVKAGQGQGRLQVTVRIMKTATAHPWIGAKRRFAGKMDKARMERLRKDEGWKHNFKMQVQVELDRDIKIAEAAPEWDMERAILTLVKRAKSEKGGSHSEVEIRNTLERALKEVNAA